MGINLLEFWVYITQYWFIGCNNFNFPRRARNKIYILINWKQFKEITTYYIKKVKPILFLIIFFVMNIHDKFNFFNKLYM